MRKIILSRRCGECFACCTVMVIKQLSKPAGEKCPHQADLPVVRPEGAPKLMGCCDIYNKRPPECKTFQCLWLAETHPKLMKYAKHRKAPRMFTKHDRPDISGILFHPPGDTAVGVFKSALHAREVWEGAAEEETGKALLNRLGDTRLIVLIRGDRRTMFGPEDIMKSLAEAFQQQTKDKT